MAREVTGGVAMMDEDAKLLPCPFCGGEACVSIGRHIMSDFGSDAYAYVTCGECWASTDEVYGDKVDESEIVKQAVAAWNRRAERACRIVRVQPGWWECDACGRSIRWDLDEPPHMHYCPRCGARVVEP